ncbi:branched-chain amino acid transport system permease protein [Halohasta litchfieldiae]|jgi:branched-chain amino acid transport system permease protein|uniref:Branched-chain amino acid transport system permease protein n=1 Tax=Halohasta litchfieldiae TaxID=1073996 RepID=A0A1H6WWQ1_9EURY|nr:branched-chain amino acid ABC transporter permease [Halohasta litchfieldiae]ATW89196.1 branched-chain amino acid transport system permease protein [Halohasta litchfieldiae]SEJ19734.1 branched-chain amino acid transport system permease protein [Halohasta litchfieldiae]
MSVLELVANGLIFSSILVLGSIGLSLIYSIANFANFAHGDTMTVGAYSALVTFGAVGGLGGSVLGLPYGFFVALLVGAAMAAVVAVVTEKVVYESLDIGSIGLLITSIGIAFIYRSVIQIGFGADFTRFDIVALRPIEWLVPYGIRVTQHDVAIVISAAILVGGLHVLLQYTDLGRKMRAMADNPDLARISGIRTKRITLVTWVIGAGLAGAGGVFLGLFNQLAPRMGFNLLLLIFAAVILGGIGSIYGAMLGGFLIGMISQLTPVLEMVGIPIGIEYANAIAFVIMVVVLLVRPTGIAGEAT